MPGRGRAAREGKGCWLVGQDMMPQLCCADMCLCAMLSRRRAREGQTAYRSSRRCTMRAAVTRRGEETDKASTATTPIAGDARSSTLRWLNIYG